MNRFLLILLLIPTLGIAEEITTQEAPQVDYLIAGGAAIATAFLAKFGEWLFQKIFSGCAQTNKEVTIKVTTTNTLLTALLKITYWGAIAGIVTGIAGLILIQSPSVSLHSFLFGLQNLTWVVVNVVIILISTKAITNVINSEERP